MDEASSRSCEAEPLNGADGSSNTEKWIADGSVVASEASTSTAASSMQNGWLQRLQQPRNRTTLLINLAAIMERMDEQMLPAVYSEVGRSFNASPSDLGMLTFARAIVQVLCSPVGGILGHYYNRIWVISAGCGLWGTTTAVFTICRSVRSGMVVWAVNGVGLALVIPCSQSLTADYYDAGSRGRAFGMLYLTAALGGMLGSLWATNVAAVRPFGMEGWHIAFLVVAAASLAIGAANALFGRDPREDTDAAELNSEGSIKSTELNARELAREMLAIWRIPTFLLIVIQGVLGTIPWQAMVFFTLYLQLLGMSNLAASSLMALFLGATALGGLLGGWLGDRVAPLWPNHGRILLVQFFVFIGIPFSLLILKGLPRNGSPGTVALYAVAFIAMGLLKPWAAPGCNNPVFAEIVPGRLRNMIYAFDRCFEGAIAACAAPLVGFLAQHVFGFSGAAAREADPETNLHKAEALGNALLVFLVVPWTLCLLLYTGLHWTYPKDKLRAAVLLETVSALDLAEAGDNAAASAVSDGDAADYASNGSGSARLTRSRKCA